MHIAGRVFRVRHLVDPARCPRIMRHAAVELLFERSKELRGPVDGPRPAGPVTLAWENTDLNPLEIVVRHPVDLHGRLCPLPAHSPC